MSDLLQNLKALHQQIGVMILRLEWPHASVVKPQPATPEVINQVYYQLGCHLDLKKELTREKIYLDSLMWILFPPWSEVRRYTKRRIAELEKDVEFTAEEAKRYGP